MKNPADSQEPAGFLFFGHFILKHAGNDLIPTCLVGLKLLCFAALSVLQ
jgi:hypothetical protein